MSGLNVYGDEFEGIVRKQFEKEEEENHQSMNCGRNSRVSN
jgi:hypothetical protein